MPLAELQAALGSMIAQQAAGQTPAVDASALTTEERRWLDSLPSTRGFRVTCDIQRWWRETRLRGMVRLTLAALGAEASAHWLSLYLRAQTCPSLFFLPEAMAFLDFLTNHTQPPHVAAIAQFERALLQAKDGEPAVQFVEFAAPPATVLAALLQKQPLPPPCAEQFLVAVSSVLPHLWEPVSRAEARKMALP